ncbi:MAG TPA: MM0924 family protein [Candidatus Lokiarchaeia archaeon]|nr:MM0924 family protein [Candidatus Lokiarchaeia archaeon]
MVLGITKFISEHLINNPVDVYCGGISSSGVPDTFHGMAISCADDVLILKDEDTHSLTYLNAEKIVAIWGRPAKKKKATEGEQASEE